MFDEQPRTNQPQLYDQILKQTPNRIQEQRLYLRSRALQQKVMIPRLAFHPTFLLWFLATRKQLKQQTGENGKQRHDIAKRGPKHAMTDCGRTGTLDAVFVFSGRPVLP